MRKSSDRCLAALLAAALGGAALAQNAGDAGTPPQPVGVIGAPAGTGPLPAVAESDASMRLNTLYHPVKLPRQALPLVLWAEGGCRDEGLMYSAFLREIASHGYFIVAAGYPRSERAADSPRAARSPAQPPATQCHRHTADSARGTGGRCDQQRTAAAGHRLGARAATRTRRARCTGTST